MHAPDAAMPLIGPHCRLGCVFAIVSNALCMDSAYIARGRAEGRGCFSADSDIVCIACW